MATDLPKVQGYVPPVVYDKLLEYRETYALKSISQAVTKVLMEFFGVTDSPVNQISDSLPTRMNSLEGKVTDLGRQLEELNQVVTQFTSNSPIHSLPDTSKSKTSELNSELKLDLPLEHQEGKTDAREEASESSSETVFDSLREVQADSLRESTSELLSKSLTEVPERETEYRSEALSVLLSDSRPDTSKTDLSELDNELKLDSPLEHLKAKTDVTEESSESRSEISFESLQEAPTTGLRETTDELLSKSPAEVPEGETQNSSKAFSQSPPEALRQKDMQMRLNVPSSTLASAKKRPDFVQWIQERDPDGITWMWNPKIKRFVPADDNR
jgi:hypothetical protein